MRSGVMFAAAQLQHLPAGSVKGRASALDKHQVCVVSSAAASTCLGNARRVQLKMAAAPEKDVKRSAGLAAQRSGLLSGVNSVVASCSLEGAVTACMIDLTRSRIELQ